jgi:uncharacterized protein YraI
MEGVVMSHRSNRRTGRRNGLRGLALAAAVLVPAAWTAAQTAEPEPYIAVVTADDVYVRSGASESYYPFGVVETGDLVKVVGEKFNWARVATIGPAFDDLFGYIRYPKSETGRFRLSDDGKTGRTLGRVDILAPNLNTNHNPKDSWKPIARLEADQRVIVLETLETERATAHKVVLPPDAVAWVNLAHLAPATPSQIAMWESTVREPEPVRTAEAEPAPPAPPPAVTPAERVVDSGTPEPEPPAEEETPTATVAAPAAPDAAIEAAPEPAEEIAAAPEPAPVEREETVVLAREEPEVAPVRELEVPAPAEPAIEPAPAIDTTALLDADLDQLEAAFQQLQDLPLENAEVRPLQALYVSFADRPGTPKKMAAYARARARQLELWAELQAREAQLRQLRSRVHQSGERTIASIQALRESSRYVAIGRIAVSAIYDGQNLPKLFRLRDPGTGRTIAYLRPNGQFQLVDMIGRIVGIAGEQAYDPGLRLPIITPYRIDALGPQERRTGPGAG